VAPGMAELNVNFEIQLFGVFSLVTTENNASKLNLNMTITFFTKVHFVTATASKTFTPSIQTIDYRPAM
jgi:hypothetical protein